MSLWKWRKLLRFQNALAPSQYWLPVNVHELWKDTYTTVIDLRLWTDWFCGTSYMGAGKRKQDSTLVWFYDICSLNSKV